MKDAQDAFDEAAKKSRAEKELKDHGNIGGWECRTEENRDMSNTGEVEEVSRRIICERDQEKVEIGDNGRLQAHLRSAKTMNDYENPDNIRILSG